MSARLAGHIHVALNRICDLVDVFRMTAFAMWKPRLLKYGPATLLILGLAIGVLLGPSDLAIVAMGAGFAGSIAAQIYATSRVWLESLTGEFEAVSRPATPEAIARSLTALAEIGFERPLLWVNHGEVGATAISTDATTFASVVEDGRTLVFSTRWTGARLRTSNRLVVPTQPSDYIQVRPKADVAALLELHRDGVDVLGRIHGVALPHHPPTLDALNSRLAHDREAYLANRYRQPAKLLAFGGYGWRLRTRFGLSVPAWLLALAVGITWLLVILAIMAAITQASAFALVVAALFVFPAAWSTIALLRRRRAGVR